MGPRIGTAALSGEESRPLDVYSVATVGTFADCLQMTPDVPRGTMMTISRSFFVVVVLVVDDRRRRLAAAGHRSAVQQVPGHRPPAARVARRRARPRSERRGRRRSRRGNETLVM